MITQTMAKFSLFLEVAGLLLCL